MLLLLPRLCKKVNHMTRSFIVALSSDLALSYSMCEAFMANSYWLLAANKMMKNKPVKRRKT